MTNFTFRNTTKLMFGKGALAGVGKEIRSYGGKVLLVTGGGSVKAMGLYDKVVAELRGAGLSFVELTGIQSNPKLSSVYQGIDICKREGVDFILAVGGGSVLDASKAIAIGAKSERDVWDYYLTWPTQKYPITDALPLGTVLTLAATGSEMNGNSVITNWETKDKLAVAGCEAIFPKFSVLDPENTYSVSPANTVNGCADIMAHTFEAYFSHTKETPLQDRICEGLIRTTVENSYRVVKNPRDYDTRANIMWCGTMALNNIAGLGKAQDWACHGMEHELSGIYDIPHGAGLAILFPVWMRYVLSEGSGLFSQYAQRVWDVEAKGKSDEAIALEGIARTAAFFKEVGLPSRLSEVGIDDKNFDVMAEKAVRFGPLGGYMSLKKADVLAIYRAAL
ncbi:MAG: iron-containing alcohol dehydrogenase [Treponemataceae bacterium]